ncbi:GNAT family N-acetyltransferase [Thalassococcus sp. S3]|uniref:GNAT family N-acetyltransferase n=1 Tax=Thalassococcus sp. S3 TaxID=2017482 RepID=UPI0010241CDE|nr:GNAT family N-acetyltransferase [Thalassococcus sp. S3]QBF31964.1 GNAT family N-acetyltransferase [Thalassococcus sp. S3]
MTDRIETSRLTLRRIARVDAPEIAVLLNNLDVARWLTRVPFPYGPDDALEFTGRVEDDGTDHFAVLQENRFIGCISSEDHLGYWFGEPFWGHGFATEAGRAVVDRHFANGGEDLVSGYLEGNAASCKVLTKLGFRDTHVEPTFTRSLGHAVDQQKMILTRAGWEAAQ